MDLKIALRVVQASEESGSDLYVRIHYLGWLGQGEVVGIFYRRIGDLLASIARAIKFSDDPVALAGELELTSCSPLGDGFILF